MPVFLGRKGSTGVSPITGTFLGVPMIRIKIHWGLQRGPLVLGNYHFASAFGSRTITSRGELWFSDQESAWRFAGSSTRDYSSDSSGYVAI